MGSGGPMKHIIGPLQIAGGAGLSLIPGGAAIGVPLLMAGIGETAGQEAGGSQGAMIGEMTGGAAGGVGEGFGGMGPLGSFLGGLGKGGAGAAASAPQAAGGSPNLMSMLNSPVIGQLAGGMTQQPQQAPMQPPAMPPRPSMGAATPPQVTPPPAPNLMAGTGGMNPQAMARLAQILSGGSTMMA